MKIKTLGKEHTVWTLGFLRQDMAVKRPHTFTMAELRFYQPQKILSWMHLSVSPQAWPVWIAAVVPLTVGEWWGSATGERLEEKE